MPDLNDLALLWLHYFSLNEKKRKAILDLFNEPKDIFDDLKNKKQELENIAGKMQADRMLDVDPTEVVNGLIKKLKNLKISFITRNSVYYPEQLREIPNSPLVLFYVGDINVLKEKAIAVVGTRKPTSYGKFVVKDFCQKLLKANLVIVSGLAFGIDFIAHSTALEENGKTIAVMGGGLDEIYPAAHTMLAKQIIKKGGLIISEYFPGMRPTAYTFPERNRIISGIAIGVLVVEAGENSGSLHTISAAIEQGRELFVVPANINSSASFGSNRILVEMPHAMVTNCDQILERFGLNLSLNNNRTLLNEPQKLIYDLICREPLSFDDLAKKTKISTSNLSSLLTIMEMSGIIKRLPGNIIMAISKME